MSSYISFPKLGIKLPIGDTIVSFSLFGVQFSLKWYGLLIALGFLLAVVYALRRAPKFGIDPDRMIDVVLVSALFAFVGARLYYVIFSEDRADYFSHPLSIFQVWRGGLAIYGGIIFAFATALWMCRVRKVNTLAMFDLGSIGFFIGQGIGRWGNFFNQEAFGGNTNLPWGMSGSQIASGLVNTTTQYDPSLPVHPTFLYESLWCLAGFLILHFVSKRAYKFKGELFSLYLVWYGMGRFMIESLRTDSLELGTMRVSKLVSVLAVAGGLTLFFVLKSRINSLPADLFAEAAGMASPDGAETGGVSDEEALEEAEEEAAEDAAEQAAEETAESAEAQAEEAEDQAAAQAEAQAEEREAASEAAEDAVEREKAGEFPVGTDREEKTDAADDNK